MFSEEKIQLVASYVAAVSAYYSAACELEAGMITGSADMYARLREATEAARAVCEAARKELDDHEASDKCAA